MDYLRSVGLLCLLIVVFPPAALAQIEKPDSSPGFDPTPVEIPDIHKTAPRPVTSMDLLTVARSPRHSDLARRKTCGLCTWPSRL